MIWLYIAGGGLFFVLGWVVGEIIFDLWRP